MKHNKYLNFQEKTEYTLIQEKLREYSLGSLLFAFLDADWSRWEREAADLKERCHIPNIDDSAYLDTNDSGKNYMIAANYFHKLFHELGTLHPFFPQVIWEMLEDTVSKKFPDQYELVITIMLELFMYSIQDETVSARMQVFEEMQTKDVTLVEATNEFLSDFLYFCGEMEQYKQNLLACCAFALDRETKQNPIERYYAMQKEGFTPLLQMQKAAPLPLVEQRILQKGTLSDTEENSTLVAHAFYTAMDIRTLIFAEFQYMCANNYSIAKCQHCGQYFLPHSKASIYCDRLADESSGKTCKEAASAIKYLRSVSTDQAKQLYNQYRNNYQMRVRRDPETFPYSDYAAWMDSAHTLLKEVKKGTLSIEEFDKRIALPKTKEIRERLEDENN